MLCLGVPLLLAAQKFPSKGIPLLQNYSPDDYGEAGKVWAIDGADNGIVYFASDKGVLSFDGHRWDRYAGSPGFTRSLAISNDSLFHTGSDKDFGRWVRNDLGRFFFSSLNPFRQSTEGSNEEFWGTYPFEDDLVFVSFDNLYLYKNEQLIKIPAPSRFSGSFRSGEKIYVVDEQTGLYEFNGKDLLPVAAFSPAIYAGSPRVIGASQLSEGLLLVTRDDGLFLSKNGQLNPVENKVSDLLKRDRVFSFTTIEDTHLAFGTILNGIYITDLSGRIILHINKQKGLLNNTVLSVHYAQRGKLWLGMDFGIASVDLWSDVAYFLDQRGQVGTGYTATLHQSNFYLGANQGLYTSKWDELDNDEGEMEFQLLPGSSGQVWSLAEVDGQLLCGHDRGLFRVNGSGLTRLHNEPGVLTIARLGKDHLLTGNYNGVSLFTRRGENWTFLKKMDPLQGACSELEVVGEETLWVNLPNFGVIKTTLDEAYTITNQRIFPIDSFGGESVQLLNEDGRIRVLTASAVYTYRPQSDDFSRELLRETPQHRVKNTLPGVHRPIRLNEDYAFYPVYNGFALRNVGYGGQPPRLAPLAIRSVEAFNNDTIRLLASSEEVPVRLNNLRIRYIVPHGKGVQYQYFLDNHSTEWSTWSSEKEAEFLNLRPREYRFRVRAMIGGEAGPERSFRVQVACPWYKTNWAYAVYVFMGIAFFYANARWQKWKLRKEEGKLLEKEKEALRKRAEARERKNQEDKYRTLEEAMAGVKKQLRTKTIELAKKAKENEEKNRILQRLRQQIDSLEKESESSRFRWSQISRILDAVPEREDNSFDLQLEELNRDFLKILNDRYPNLTNYDLRLAAYIKSGLSTKEIAGLMNVLPSSVNVSRSRLRKKLGLESKDDLGKFLNKLVQ